MKGLLRFTDWSLRAKMAAVLVVASLVPLTIATLVDIRETRTALLAHTAALLAARSDQLVGQLDTFNRGYQYAANRVAHLPDVQDFLLTNTDGRIAGLRSLRRLLSVWPASDRNIRGVAVVDSSGAVIAATDDELVGSSLAYHEFMRRALNGHQIISDVHFAEPQMQLEPSIAFVAPVFNADKQLLGLTVFWVRASALWNVMKTSNGLAGPGSFAVLFDHLGIRIAHTYSDAIMFRPGGKLDGSTIDALVAESRFGPQTRQLLEDVRAFPQQFDRSLAESPDLQMFHGFAPVNRQWNFGIARRFTTVPWTVFYMVPETTLLAQVAEATRHKTVLAAAITLLALFAGAFLAALILRPIHALTRAAQSIGAGDLSARVQLNQTDELGLLGTHFDAMAERIEAQTRALQSEAHSNKELLRGIVESSDDAIISKTLQGIITSWNSGAEKLFGFSAQEAIGQPMQMLIPAERIDEELGILKRIASGDSINHFETVRVRKDGTHIDVSTTISPIRDAQGQIIGASKLAHDISERKRTEEILLEQARVLDLAQIMIRDMDGRIILWNQGAEKLYGYKRSEAVGRVSHELLQTESAEPLERIQTTLELTGSWEGELTHQTQDGRQIVVASVWVLHRDAQGRPARVLEANTDITERKLVELKLAAQLGRLNLLDSITRAIGERQDLASIFQVVVATLEDQLPLDFCCICSTDATQQSLTVVGVGASSESTAAALQMSQHAQIAIDEDGLSRCLSGQLVYEPDITLVPSAFPQRLVGNGLRSLVIAPLSVENRVFGMIIAARRHSQGFSSGECEFLKQLAEHTALAARQADLFSTLQSAYEDLRRTQEAVMQHERLRVMGQMASGIAHDINNAISPVTLYTEVLLERDPSLSDQAREYLLTIQQSISDVAQTVSRMREFYREREPQSALVPVFLNTLVQQAIDLTRARWNDMALERGTVIQMASDLGFELPAVMGVESEIREALTNLIFNAVDAMPDGGTITIRTTTTPQGAGSQADTAEPVRVCLEIRDTGIGMNESTRQRCLEPFFTTKGDRGTGLGLAMVYGTLQRHGAEIEIESKPGHGTTMRLIFFVPTVSAVPALRDVPAPDVPENLRILLVDDDPILLRSLSSALRHDGHTIVASDGGRAGIEAFRAAQSGGDAFSIVITDLGMPHVDGRRVAAAVKAASPATPVIMLTGWGQQLREAEIPAHVDRLLSKPPRLIELRTALAELCGGSRP